MSQQDSNHSYIETASLISKGKAAEAAAALEAMGPPEELGPLERTELAQAWCYFQKEEAAADLIADLPFPGNEAHGLLARYFASREAMVKKIKVNDPVGETWSKFYRSHPLYRAECRLSAAMIVKNEAQHIEGCIKSLLGLVDEIVLVDTGSTDNTIELAKAAAGKTPIVVGNFAWVEDFSAARNESIRLASGDWLLWVDADEEVTLESQGEVRQALIRPYFGGFHLRIINFTGDDGDNSTFNHMAMRLFRRLPSTKFVGRIHEQVSDSLTSAGLPLGNLGTANLLHYGYRPSEMAQKNKQERFVSMLEREVRENPTNAFQWFNLANAYQVYGRMPEAEHAARSAIRLAADDAMVLPLSYTTLAGALIHQNRSEEALEVLDEAASRGIVSIFTEFERGNALLRLERPAEAIEVVDRCMELEWPLHATGDYTIFSFKRHLLRGQVLALLGRTDEALAMFDYALSAQPDYTQTLYLKAATLASRGEHAAALPLYEAVSHDPALRALALQGIGRAFAREDRYVDAAKAFEEAWLLDPTNYDAWAAWASACEAAKDLDTVVRAYSAFAKQNEPNAEILINWGRALDRAGQHQRALDCFSEALQRAPLDPNAYFNTGDLLYRFGHYQDAAFLFEKGLRLNPDHASGWFVLGNSLAHLGFVDVARTSFERALTIDPDYSEARHNLEVLSEPISA